VLALLLCFRLTRGESRSTAPRKCTKHCVCLPEILCLFELNFPDASVTSYNEVFHEALVPCSEGPKPVHRSVGALSISAKLYDTVPYSAGIVQVRHHVLTTHSQNHASSAGLDSKAPLNKGSQRKDHGWPSNGTHVPLCRGCMYSFLPDGLPSPATPEGRPWVCLSGVCRAFVHRLAVRVLVQIRRPVPCTA